MNDIVDFGIDRHCGQVKLSILGEDFYLSHFQFTALTNLLNVYWRNNEPVHCRDFGYYKRKDAEVRAFAEEKKPSDLLRMLGLKKRIDISDLGDI